MLGKVSYANFPDFRRTYTNFAVTALSRKKEYFAASPRPFENLAVVANATAQKDVRRTFNFTVRSPLPGHRQAVSSRSDRKPVSCVQGVPQRLSPTKALHNL